VIEFDYEKKESIILFQSLLIFDEKEPILQANFSCTSEKRPGTLLSEKSQYCKCNLRIKKLFSSKNRSSKRKPEILQERVEILFKRIDFFKKRMIF